jgi:glucose/arabinose dehydrogenase
MRCQGATTTVSMSNFSFIPSMVTVNVGDTVIWINDQGEHTVTGVGSDVFCGTPTVPVSCSVTFLQPGSFPYVCLLHEFQGMIGTVNVVGTNQPVRVAITSPTAGERLTASGAAVLVATNLSAVEFSEVEFFDDEQSLGVVTNSPFQLSVTLNIGSHTLTARSKSTDGGISTSAPISVTVDFEIPNPIVQPIARSTKVIELESVMEGLVAPLGIAALDDGSARLLIYDQVGLIHLISGGVPLPTPFLDLRSRIVTLNTNYDERGLLGVAAHPNFAQNALIYTYTSEPIGPAADFTIPLPEGQTHNHQSVIAEWRLDGANTNRALPGSRRELLRLDKPQPNHNGGTLRFGHDGFLYIATGDGGAADDQGPGHVAGGNAQSLTNLLGKIIRIDVDGRSSANGQYGVPGDNPWVNQDGPRREIFAYGFRNPYAFSFDRLTGELWLGDVGQNQIEEVNVVIKGGNYGWPLKEGSFFFNANGNNSGYVTLTPAASLPPDLIDPQAEYDHDEGEAIIGGFVYRGSSATNLAGMYLTGDYSRSGAGQGRLFAVRSNSLTELRIGLGNRGLGMLLKGFGEDADGELYVLGSTTTGPAGTTGKVFKIVPPSANSLAIVAIDMTQNGVMLSWAGGTPPYRVQKKMSLSAPQWTDLQTTSQQELILPTAGAAGFFRIIDQGGSLP